MKNETIHTSEKTEYRHQINFFAEEIFIDREQILSKIKTGMMECKNKKMMGKYHKVIT